MQDIQKIAFATRDFVSPTAQFVRFSTRIQRVFTAGFTASDLPIKNRKLLLNPRSNDMPWGEAEGCALLTHAFIARAIERDIFHKLNFVMYLCIETRPSLGKESTADLSTIVATRENEQYCGIGDRCHNYERAYVRFLLLPKKRAVLSKAAFRTYPYVRTSDNRWQISLGI